MADELRAYNPTFSERVGNVLSDILRGAGADPYVAGRLAHGVRDIAQLTPAGIPMAIGDMQHARGQGNVLDTIINAAGGVVPAARPVAQAAAGAVREALPGIRAFHGSPHDFDKFSLDKIGTGEGAQAYGHGLYFAENEGVARGYRDVLSSNTGDTVNDAAAKMIALRGGDRDQAIAKVESNIKNMRDRVAETSGNVKADWESRLVHDTRVLEALRSGKGQGHMYEVNIAADPAHFLDWDKGIKEQPQAVQDAFFAAHPLGDKFKQKFAAQQELPQVEAQVKQRMDAGLLDRDTNNLIMRRDELRRAAKSEVDEGRSINAMLHDMGGHVPAAEKLRDAGVPGIKYLDQGSRGPSARMQTLQERINREKAQGLPYDHWEKELAEETAKQQTSNYVVFDDSLINVVRKYGLAGLSMLPPATAAYMAQKMKPVDYNPYGEPVDYDPFAVADPNKT